MKSMLISFSHAFLLFIIDLRVSYYNLNHYRKPNTYATSCKADDVRPESMHCQFWCNQYSIGLKTQCKNSCCSTLKQLRDKYVLQFENTPKLGTFGYRMLFLHFVKTSLGPRKQ